MSQLREIADALVAVCKNPEAGTAHLDTMYAEDAVSVEAAAAPGMDSPVTEGRAGIRGKHEWWEGAMEWHGGSVDGPYLHGDDRFAVIFEMDVTEKATGERTQMKEVGVYHVRDGLIVREEFFYTM